MFTAYFDASGTKRSRVLTVAGFVSRVSQWDRLEGEWRALLAEAGVKSFHMTDFVSSTKGFEAWKGKSQKRATFFAALVKCIKSNTNKGFAISVQMDDYNKVNAEYQLSESLGEPYPFCGIICLAELKNWATKKGISYRKILCIFEDGDEDQNDLIARARADGFNAITQSKAEIRAFNACDLAAWKAKTAIDDVLNRKLHRAGGGPRIMESLRQIETVVHDNAMYSYKSLVSSCKLVNVLKR